MRSSINGLNNLIEFERQIGVTVWTSDPDFAEEYKLLRITERLINPNGSRKAGTRETEPMHKFVASVYKIIILTVEQVLSTYKPEIFAYNRSVLNPVYPGIPVRELELVSLERIKAEKNPKMASASAKNLAAMIVKNYAKYGPRISQVKYH